MVSSRTMNHQLERKTHYLGETKLSVLEGGVAEKGTVLFIHGIPASAELWRDIAERVIAQGYRVLAPDLPGYGLTRLPKDADYSLAGAAELLMEWLREDIAEKVYLVAHDIGGGVAQRMITAAPGLFVKATFSNAIIGDSWPVRPIILMRLMARLGLLVPMGKVGLMPNPYATWELRHSVVQQAHMKPEVRQRVFWDGKFRDEEGRKQFARHLLALNPDHTIEVEAAMMNFNHPVQLIWGMRDKHQTWMDVGKRYLKRWPDAQVVKLDGAGHFLQIDDPVEFSEALLGFWSQ